MMATSQFDPQEGRLQMTISAMAALPALATGDATPMESELLDELRRGGLVSEGCLHPRLVPLARCVAKPGVRLRLEQPSGAGSYTDAWLDERLGVLFRVSHGSQVGDVVAVPRGMVPFRLARLIELGPLPRSKVTDPIELDEGLIETLLTPGERLTGSQISSLLGSGDDVIPEWLSVLAAVSGSPIVRWRVGAWWNSSQEAPVARSLEVAKSDVGCFLIVRRPRQERRYRRVALYPLTSSQIWRLLCALVPPAEQVSEPLAH